VWHTVRLGRQSVYHFGSRRHLVRTYLADRDGRALYTFSLDSLQPGTQPTNCAGGCAGSWYRVIPDGPLVVSAPLRAADFGYLTLNEQGHVAQLTYRGMPLYGYYGDDPTRRDRVMGHGRTEFGGEWRLAEP